jgi:ferric-dicitrate binding protein FerR (iron transport regulator)
MFQIHVHKKLTRYCHGELSVEEAARVERHLAGCPRCRREYEQIKSGIEFLAKLSRESAPPTLWNEISQSLDRPQPAHGWTAIPALGYAAAALVLLSALGAWMYFRQDRKTPEMVLTPSWSVQRVEGAPKAGERTVNDRGELRVGESLVTDSASRASLNVSDIGEVEVEPNTRLVLVRTREEEHRVDLTRGKLHAVIWAPPGKFVVDTPTASAVDLGCAYTLAVDDDGRGLLEVQVGIVAFEKNGRESFVPEGAACVTRPGLGPGTPYFSDSPPAFREALARFDENGGDALRDVLKLARKRDALTLWHLLTRTSGAGRELVFDRLSRLLPPPSGVTREGVLGGDRNMLDAWGGEFELVDLAFWRGWKRPMPEGK